MAPGRRAAPEAEPVNQGGDAARSVRYCQIGIPPTTDDQQAPRCRRRSDRIQDVGDRLLNSLTAAGVGQDFIDVSCNSDGIEHLGDPGEVVCDHGDMDASRNPGEQFGQPGSGVDRPSGIGQVRAGRATGQHGLTRSETNCPAKDLDCLIAVLGLALHMSERGVGRKQIVATLEESAHSPDQRTGLVRSRLGELIGGVPGECLHRQIADMHDAVKGKQDRQRWLGNARFRLRMAWRGRIWRYWRHIGEPIRGSCSGVLPQRR